MPSPLASSLLRSGKRGGRLPNGVVIGDTVWVAKWFLDAADKEIFAWDKGAVVGGSKKVKLGEETVVMVLVRSESHRTPHEAPLRHIRTAAPPNSASDDGVQVLLTPTALCLARGPLLLQGQS